VEDGNDACCEALLVVHRGRAARDRDRDRDHDHDHDHDHDLDLERERDLDHDHDHARGSPLTGQRGAAPPRGRDPRPLRKPARTRFLPKNGGGRLLAPEASERERG
jgi:hypothetical protein